VAEAKRRMRRRRLFGATLLLVLATATALLLRSAPGPSPGGQSPSAGALHPYHSSLGWSLQYPNGMHVEHAGASGISYYIDEVTFSTFHSLPGVLRSVGSQGETIRPMPPRISPETFPAHGIALRVLRLETLRVFQQPATLLPLHLSSFRAGGRPFGDWYPGTHPRPLQHFLVSKSGQRFFVQVWIGPKASARQRARLARIVASLAVTPPRIRP
jgi:hypothetical protein